MLYLQTSSSDYLGSSEAAQQVDRQLDACDI